MTFGSVAELEHDRTAQKPRTAYLRQIGGHDEVDSAVARAIAASAIERSHEVMLSSGLGPGTLRAAVAELGSKASAAPVHIAAAVAIVILTVPWSRVELSMKTLNGKVALVTGGSRALGAVTAQALAGQGADVAVSYFVAEDRAKDVVRDIEVLGMRGASFQADQGDQVAASAVIHRVIVRSEPFFWTLCFPRFARTEKVVAPTLFFASPTASFITGASIDAEGGFNA